MQPRKIPSCRFLDYDLCPHREISKTPKKNLIYRPLLPLLAELLQTEYFAEYCSHALRFVEERPWHEGDDYVYCDFLSGREAQKHIKEMHERFLDYERTGEVEGVVEISLLASDYYDGEKMMERNKNKAAFWPLFIGFMSLPVSVRGKYGAGCFFWGFMTSQPGSIVEQFLLRDCVIPELQLLEEGVTITVCDISYFVQVRAVNHVYDTKGKEKIDHSLGTNSYPGCIKCMANPGN